MKRVIDDLDGAFIDLQHAERTAIDNGLTAEQARVHFLRGNLYFPKGDLASCHSEHDRGLYFAREAGRLDLVAASLGGIGDAEYMRGRMASARRRLEECVDVADRQGLGRIAVANKAQIAHALLYDGSQMNALQAARTAAQAAEQVGHLRAEINARAAAVKALLSLAQYEDCIQEIEVFEKRIEQLGANRFRQVAYMHRGPSLHALGRREEAIATLEEGIGFAHATGFAFHGPSILSALAIVLNDKARQRQLIREAWIACTTGCVGHNQFRVYTDGIDVAYALDDVELMQTFIDLTSEYPEGETLVWSNFHAMRGRALLGVLTGHADWKAGWVPVAAMGGELGMTRWCRRGDPRA